jgi:hypothetical protein
MWECDNCGTISIAGSVAVCPHCGVARTVAPAQDVSSGPPAQGGQDSEESRPEESAPSGGPDDAQEQEEKADA